MLLIDPARRLARGFRPDSYAVDAWHRRLGPLGAIPVGRLETAKLLAAGLVASGTATHAFIGVNISRVPREPGDWLWYGTRGIVDGDGWRDLGFSHAQFAIESEDA